MSVYVSSEIILFLAVQGMPHCLTFMSREGVEPLTR
jgi:hypothetical protein